jgi:hypothetical protein
LNDEILGSIRFCIDSWFDKMTIGADNIAGALYQPVWDILEAVKTDLQACTATPELAGAAIEALEEMTEEIEVASTDLVEKLHSSLDDTHLRFTTEIDIECPIAQTMKPSYRHASDPKFISSGKGLFKRQRKVLRDSMLKPSRHYNQLDPGEERIKALFDTLQEQLVSRQNEVWKKDCLSFTGKATQLL